MTEIKRKVIQQSKGSGYTWRVTQCEKVGSKSRMQSQQTRGSSNCETNANSSSSELKNSSTNVNNKYVFRAGVRVESA